MFESVILTRSLTPTVSTLKIREYFTNTVSHDLTLPHRDARVKYGKRQLQPMQRQQQQRSASGIRLNDSNRSQFTIGHSDCLFSTHQSLQPRAETSATRSHGKQHQQANQSKSLVDLRGHCSLNVVQEKSDNRPNILAQAPPSSATTQVDQQVKQRASYLAEIQGKTNSVTYGQKRRESGLNQVSVSPSSQQVVAAQAKSVYEAQQNIFADIKRRNGMSSNGIKTAFWQSNPKLGQAEKENQLLSSIQNLSVENKKRKQNAAKRCLTSQIGQRLRLSERPAKGEYVPDAGMNQRINKIEESIFKEEKNANKLTRTDRSLNQQLSSVNNTLFANARSRSPVFGGCRERSISGPHRSEPNVKFAYIKNEEVQSVPDQQVASKPNQVEMADFSKALENSRYDLKKIAVFEVERANRRVERAAKQKPYEPKKQRQTYNVLDQGPSHGPGYSRPHTMVFQKGLKGGHHESSMASLSCHPKQFNRRRTENTIYAQDYLKQWDKIKKIQPVLERAKMNEAINNTINGTANMSTASCLKVAAKSTRRSNATKSTTVSDSMTTSARLTTGRTAQQTTLNFSSMMNMTSDQSSSFATLQFKSGNYMTQTRASKSKQVIR